MLRVSWENSNLSDQMSSLLVGEQVTVYVVRRNIKSGKIALSLEPSSQPLVGAESLVVDGQTVVEGTVRDICDMGVFVRIGSDVDGLLSRRTNDVSVLDS